MSYPLASVRRYQWSQVLFSVPTHVSVDLCSTPKLMSLKRTYVNIYFPYSKPFLWLHSSEGGTRALTCLQASCFTFCQSSWTSVSRVAFPSPWVSCLLLITLLKSLWLHSPRSTAVGRTCFYDMSRRATGLNSALEIQVQIQFEHGDIREQGTTDPPSLPDSTSPPSSPSLGFLPKHTKRATALSYGPAKRGHWPFQIFIFNLKNDANGAGEMPWWLRALSEGSILSTHMAAYNNLEL